MSSRNAHNENWDYSKARERMVKEQVQGRGIQDPRVIHAIRKVPRHLFVPEALTGQAYGDCALPIGEGQTISQPYMVAYLSEALGLSGIERVLEIGTGSGYQAAILANLARFVYSVERIRSLLEQARKIYDQIQVRNIFTRLSDGSLGWKEEAPFDAILVTSGAPAVPPPLLDQLKAEGTLVIPVGGRNSQKILRIKKTGQGFLEEELIDCNFVALVGEYGWAKRKKFSSI